MEKAKKKARKPLSYSDLLDMTGDSDENIRSALLDYYLSEKGQQDIAASPHRGKSAEAVVDDLMKEVIALKGR